MALGTLYGEPLPIEQIFYAEHGQDVASPIHALPAPAFGWPEGTELGFPVAEDIRLNPG
jgi:hypothetical protein